MRFLGLFVALWILASVGYAHMHEPDSLLDRAAARATSSSVPAHDPFTLTDTQGASITNETLKNGYHLVFFGFTQCPDECPQAMNLIATVYGKLPVEQQKKLQVVMVSVDPDHDSAKVLADYVHGFNPAFTGWRGEMPQIDRIARDFMTYHGSKDGHVSHSAFIFLTGPDRQTLQPGDH
jgi:protein SCO1/2